jgi:hypothetical protein
MSDEYLDCPAEHMTFELDDTLVSRGYAKAPGAADLWMRCQDCGTWAILRYHPDYPLDGLHERMRELAPGRHASQFEALVRGIRAREGQTT